MDHACEYGAVREFRRSATCNDGAPLGVARLFIVWYSEPTPREVDMKIGLVVYSWSGHTKQVFERLRDALSAKGRNASIVEVEVLGERPQGSRTFQLPDPDDLSAYDALVFGAAVEAFSLSPVMAEYLRRAVGLGGKKVACLVSQQFPFAWMGGNRALRQMSKACKAQGASVIGSAVVHWTSSKRESSIAAAVERISTLF